MAWRYHFYLLVLKTIFYSLRSFVKYCFHHSKIKVISNEFHSHLPFDRLWSNVSKALHAVYGIYKNASHKNHELCLVYESDWCIFKATNIEIFGHLLERTWRFLSKGYTITDISHELFLWDLKLYIIFRYRNSHLQKLFKY